MSNRRTQKYNMIKEGGHTNKEHDGKHRMKKQMKSKSDQLQSEIVTAETSLNNNDSFKTVTETEQKKEKLMKDDEEYAELVAKTEKRLRVSKQQREQSHKIDSDVMCFCCKVNHGQELLTL